MELKKSGTQGSSQMLWTPLFFRVCMFKIPRPPRYPERGVNVFLCQIKLLFYAKNPPGFNNFIFGADFARILVSLQELMKCVQLFQTHSAGTKLFACKIVIGRHNFLGEDRRTAWIWEAKKIA